MNVQATKIELMKIISGINSEMLLEQLKAWLMQQLKSGDAQPQKPQVTPEEGNSFILKDGFLVFTGNLQGDIDNIIEEERMTRDLSLM